MERELDLSSLRNAVFFYQEALKAYGELLTAARRLPGGNCCAPV
jgi:hypothetical protein